MTSSGRTETPPFDLVVGGGQLILPSGAAAGSIAVRDGRVAAILPPGLMPEARKVVDARGLAVLPGLVDMHVHFREPGHLDKETFETGTAAAAAGGFTVVADMPNTVPPTTTAERFREKRDLLRGRVWVDVALWGGAGSGERVADLVDAGAVGIKVYMGLEEVGSRHADANAELIVGDDGALLDILEAATASDAVVAVHCGNRSLRERERVGWDGRGFGELRDAIAGESQLHKVEAVARVLLLAHHVRATIHIVHVPAPALGEIRRAKDRGQAVTAEAALPFVTNDQMDRFGELGFDRYRSGEDADLLWAAARDGTVDVLATDHAPHQLDEKRRAQTDLLAAPSGYPELDTALAMLLDAVARGILSLERLVELMGRAPAQILGLAGKGELAVGNDADMVLVDLGRVATVDGSRLLSKARWSPFEGRELTGWPVATLIRGVQVAAEGRVQGDPAGRFLPGRGGRR
jgi:dihydroorotase (multifunctional complex type)